MYRFPVQRSSRTLSTQQHTHLQCRETVGDQDKKTGQDTGSKAIPHPGENNSRSQLKNTNSVENLSADLTVCTIGKGANLGSANEVDSLSRIPSLDYPRATSPNSCTDSSWESTGECSAGQTDSDREQTIPKQRLNTTPAATLQTPATPGSDEANISRPVQETGTSTLHSNDNVTSSEDSGELGLRSDSPSREVQREHGESEIVTLPSAIEGREVADRQQAREICEHSKCILVCTLVCTLFSMSVTRHV